MQLPTLNVQGCCTQRLSVKHPVKHLSIGDELQNNIDNNTTEDSTHKTEAPDVFHQDIVKQADIKVFVDVKIEPQEELEAEINDVIQCSQLDDTLNVMEREPDDVETDAVQIKSEIEDITIEENQPDGACPNIVQVPLERTVPNDTISPTVFVDVKIEPQEELEAEINDVIQSSQLDDTLNVMEREPDDVDTDAVQIKSEIEDITIEENQPDGACQSSQSANNICPNIVKVPLERTVLNDIISATVSVDVKIEPQEELEAEINDVIQSSQLDDTLNVMEREPDDVDTGTTVLEKLEDSTPLLIAKSGCVNKNIKVKATSHKHRDSKVKAHYENKKDISGNKISLNKKSKSKGHLDPSTHIADTRFRCNVCNKCFKRNYHLKRHSYIHSGLKPFICHVCQGSYAQKCDLVAHIRIHTNEKPYKCNFCKKWFSHKCQLTLHRRIHTGEKPHICNLCKRCFARKSTLTEHARTHGNKPHMCDVCNKCFYEKHKLIAHTRMHTGEHKLYICDYCKKGFTRKCTLVEHIRLHTGDKPYICDVCKACFSQSSTLKVHQRTHTGEKPYMCDICQKRYRAKGTLKSHIVCKHTVE